MEIEKTTAAAPEKTLFDELRDQLTAWPNLEFQKEKILVKNDDEKITLLERRAGFYILRRMGRNAGTGAYETFNNPSHVKISTKVSKEDLLRIISIRENRFWIQNLAQIREILCLSYEMKNMEISPEFQRISISSQHQYAKVPHTTYQEMLDDAAETIKKGSSYKSSIERHLINKLIKKYRNKEIKNLTNVAKGEFNFLIHRFNLPIKKREADFKKYLNDLDLTAIEDLTRSLVANEIFNKDFLRALNDYFIKDRLADIIKLGKKILALGTTRLATDAARNVIKLVSPDKPIGQLETLWQRFFERNLWYLIFSYKKIFSKFGLLIDGNVKYPDFIGVNHYNGVDIIEIKTHLTPALVYDSSHRNFSFSPDLSKAIIQITNYMDAIRHDDFNDQEDKEKIIQQTNEENLYRPQGIIIISSWKHIIKNKKLLKTHEAAIKRDFTKLRNSLDSIQILTFDEVLDIADNYSKNILTTAS